MPQYLTLLVLGVLVVLAGGQAQLELIDGRILSGDEVHRDGAVYVLTLDDGGAISFPTELVESVRLFVKSEPETLAGPEIDPPTTAEQLEVFGEPAQFQPGVSDPTWVPETDWDMDPVKQNNFAPSTWAESPIDPNWEPTSDWDNNADILAPSRSTWQKGPIDSSWTPTDGFKSGPGRR